MLACMGQQCLCMNVSFRLLLDGLGGPLLRLEANAEGKVCLRVVTTVLGGASARRRTRHRDHEKAYHGGRNTGFVEAA